ncbi:hypothetical protein M427DRAFT_44820 [Gonapodya prolifera JEL478]|uniref:Uncharacterized protein n=1 Tax=Gonapodya prolifera (strain JEL478) TaxID=1344416 RepID=A0A139AEI8_GONPJ|nr:hypothetical protein M427DRAFT_44820 [Gonapodya prolifera JEL478]|eukprot:KXS14855.1 hypothetical protein M427DRAFT_44820 [Gonapodya prolifera JEL478]
MSPVMSNLSNFCSGFWALQDAAEWVPFSAFLEGLVAFNRSSWSRNIHESYWSLSLPREDLAEAMEKHTGALGLGIYFAHRLMHTKFLYNHVTSTSRAAPSVLWFYHPWRSVESATAHCGYYIPGLCANTLSHDCCEYSSSATIAASKSQLNSIYCRSNIRPDGFSANLDCILGTLHPKYLAWLANYRRMQSHKVGDVSQTKQEEANPTDIVDPYSEAEVKRE